MKNSKESQKLDAEDRETLLEIAKGVWLWLARRTAHNLTLYPTSRAAIRALPIHAMSEWQDAN